MAKTGAVPQLPAALLRSLETRFGQQLLTAPGDCWAYGYDNSRQHMPPQAVCIARTESDVVDLVVACKPHAVPIVSRGRGTGTTGATVPMRGGIVLALEQMRERLDIDPANRIAVVSAGFTNRELQDAVAAHGFFWPPDPTSAAVSTIGGNLAYNSAGPRAVKYGTPRENTLGLRAVDGQGRLFKTGVMTTKGVVGYDLTRLLIGSEGTLAVITEATVKLTPLAEQKRTLRGLYSNIHTAAAAVSRLMAQATTPCALEFMDRTAIHMVREFADIALPGDVGALLMIEVDGSAAAIDDDLARIVDAAKGPGCLRVDVAQNTTEVEQLWHFRRSLSPALRNVAASKINEDVVVPVSRIPDLIDGLERLSERHGLRIVNFGHAGNGNIHVNLLSNPEDADQAQAAQACLDEVFELVLALDGSLSGEHGVGWVKRQFIDRELDPTALELMRSVKCTFDPAGILNPGVGFPDA